MLQQSISSLLKQQPGVEVIVKGWVRTRRDSKAGISFLTVHDGSCFDGIQAVISNSLPNYESEVLKLTKDCAVIVSGKLVASQGSGQAVEIQAEKLEVIGLVEDPETYPMSPKRHSMEHLREYAHLRPRTNIIGAATRVRDCLAQAIHRFFHENGYFWVHTPIITASDCEGAGEMFRISTLDMLNLPKTPEGKVDFAQDFFGKEAFLTVSGQLNVEAYCLALSKVYTFGPTFRAENSNTSRHLAEFWMIEPEIAFADLKDDAALAEQLLKYVAQAVLSERADDLAFFNQWVDNTCLARLEKLANSSFTLMDYSEGIKILEQSGEKFQYPVKWGLDLQSEHERYLCEKKVNGPVVLMNYPKEIKAFYMRLNDDNKTVAAMDVLVPGIGELIGGSQREERLDVLDSRIQECGMNPNDYSWYRDLRRFGSVPHAGFGLGFERLVSYITGIANVRDVIPYPRTPGNASF
ncbi:MAG: asparagine--tRNA ligase [Gammaproteobacteria bacterium]|nr:asparagine--tRNA ligase [Gammaproteobacteria bacterium]